MSKDYHIYKHGYSILFSDPVFVQELLESFVDKNFADTLDFSTFKVDTEKHYISKDFVDFSEDLVIKIKYKGQEAYLYLLLEFQSTVDKFMALRILNYITLFYLDYLKEKQNRKEKVTLLPPVFPLLLYNGNGDWTAKDNIKDLITPHPFCEAFYPDFKYAKIIEKDYSHDDLMKIKNMVSALFLLETHEKEEYDKLISELEKIIEHENAQTIALFATYLRHMLTNKRITPDAYAAVENISNRKEAKSMLVTTLQNIEKNGEHKGILKTAKKMLDKKLSIELISEVTGLSKEEIRKLQ